MFCPKCGIKYNGDDVFCSKCGHKFKPPHESGTKSKLATRRIVLIVVPVVTVLLVVGILAVILGGNQNRIGVLAQPTTTPTASLTPTPTLSLTPTATETPSPTPSPTPTVQPYTAEEKVAAKGILAILKVLKNPDSLQVHHVSGSSYNGTTLIFIDLSAQNGFGGADRKTYGIITPAVKQTDLPSWVDTEFNVTVVEYEKGLDFSAKTVVETMLDTTRVMEIVKSGDVSQ